jgi:uncharacterized membrane protein YgcG
MWGPSDYWGEMDRLTAERIEAILSGHEAPGDEPGAARLAEVVRDLREGLLADVPAAVAAGHLEAMAAARRSEPADAIPERRSDVRAMTRRRVTLLGLAAALIIGGGLMAAAVTLPDRASETARQVLGDLPIPGPTGTPADPSANDHGQAVSELARDDSIQGCEKGTAVSDLASSKADEFRQDPGSPVDPCVQGGDDGTTASARGSGGGGGSGGTGGGGGSGGGGSEQGSGGGGGSGGTEGGGGSGGGGSEQGSGGGGGSGGTEGGGGSGGGGSEQGSGGGGVPESLPTPDEFPSGG